MGIEGQFTREQNIVLERMPKTAIEQLAKQLEDETYSGKIVRPSNGLRKNLTKAEGGAKNDTGIGSITGAKAYSKLASANIPLDRPLFPIQPSYAMLLKSRGTSHKNRIRLLHSIPSASSNSIYRKATAQASDDH